MEDFGYVRDRIRQEPVLAALRCPQSLRGEDPQNRVTQFEGKAEGLRAVADDVILSETRLTLLKLAETYERMAATIRAAATPQ